MICYYHEISAKCFCTGVYLGKSDHCFGLESRTNVFLRTVDICWEIHFTHVYLLWIEQKLYAARYLEWSRMNFIFVYVAYKRISWPWGWWSILEISVRVLTYNLHIYHYCSDGNRAIPNLPGWDYRLPLSMMSIWTRISITNQCGHTATWLYHLVTATPAVLIAVAKHNRLLKEDRTWLWLVTSCWISSLWEAVRDHMTVAAATSLNMRWMPST